MPLSPRPLHPADYAHPDEAPQGFKRWSRQVGSPAASTAPVGASRPLSPGLDLTHPLATVAAVAFVGYTLGRLLHRRT